MYNTGRQLRGNGDRTIYVPDTIPNVGENLLKNITVTANRFTQVKNLMNNFLASGLFEKRIQARKQRFELTKHLVDDYRSSELFCYSQQYDLFKSLKLRFTENQISDIIADVLDPKISQFAKPIIIKLATRIGAGTVAAIFQATPVDCITVVREVSGNSSRIDIRALTENKTGENAILDIELKVANGSETIDKDYGIPQTIREWDDLYSYVMENDSYNVENVAGIFISKYGQYAASKHFIPLARNEFNAIIHEMLMMPYSAIEQTGVLDRDAIAAIRHFFNSKWIH
jgi:hypothetical protein